VYGASVTYAYAIVAGMLTAAVLAAWPWARSRRRFGVAGWSPSLRPSWFSGLARSAGRPPSAWSAPRRSQGWSRRYWTSSSSSVLARALLDLDRPYAAPYPPESAAEGDLSGVQLSGSG
jgi:hypothetical protein